MLIPVDLSDFHLRSLNTIRAQVMFTCLSCTLRRWQLHCTGLLLHNSPQNRNRFLRTLPPNRPSVPERIQTAPTVPPPCRLTFPAPLSDRGKELIPTLQQAWPYVRLRTRMILQRICLFLCSGFLWAGCSTTTVTNLTPAHLPRNNAGLYPFEVVLDIRQQSIRRETIKPYVMIGEELIPMKPAPVLKNRWETVVQIPADQELVHYRYKFDYEFASIPIRRAGSKLSAPYRLRVYTPDPGK